MASSNLSVSSEVVKDSPQILHLVAFGMGDTAHWALFVPNRPADPRGTLVHIVLTRNRFFKSSGGVPKLACDEFKVTRSTASTVVALAGACASLEEVKYAAQACLDNFQYNLILDNCQTFIIDVLAELHRKFPSRIQESAVRLIQERHGTTPVRIQQFFDRNKQNEADGTDESTAEKPRFPID